MPPTLPTRGVQFVLGLRFGAHLVCIFPCARHPSLWLLATTPHHTALHRITPQHAARHHTLSTPQP